MRDITIQDFEDLSEAFMEADIAGQRLRPVVIVSEQEVIDLQIQMGATSWVVPPHIRGVPIVVEGNGTYRLRMDSEELASIRRAIRGLGDYWRGES